MFTATTGKLAAAVSAAGGLGFFGAGFDFSPASEQLSALDAELTAARTFLNLAPDARLPIGVGLLTTIAPPEHVVQNVTPLLSKHKPCAVWLFCPDPDASTHAAVLAHVRAVGADWALKTFVQVGSVSAAREALRDGADVIVAQGIDAGGHQWANGVGLVSIVPEIKDTLRAEFPDRHIPVIAAGGIVDGRGVVAALALGADGICMGTRFVVAEESPVTEEIKDAILAASDGGVSTIKSTVHDDIQGSNIFPALYDARALIGNSFKDYQTGISVVDLHKQHNACRSAGDNSRSIQFAGSSIGIIKQKGSAAQIVKDVKEEADRIIQQLQARI